MEQQEHFRRAGRLALVAGAGQIVSFALFIVLARRTNVSAFEDYAVAVGAGTLLASFATLGLEKYAVRVLSVFYERGDWAGARGYGIFAVRRIFTVALAAGVALALGWSLFDPGSASWAAVVVVAVFLPVVALVEFFAEVLAAGGRELRGAIFRRLVVTGAALALLLLALELPFELDGAGAVACWGMGWAVALAGLAHGIRRTAPPGVWTSRGRVQPEWQREAIPYLSYGLALTFVAQAGVLGIELLGGSEVDLGAYAAAAQTVGLVVALATSTNRFYAPRLSLLLERGDFASIEKLRRQRLSWMLPPIAVFLVGALGFGREILELFRPEFVEDGVPVLRIISLPVAFSVLFSMSPTYLNFTRRSRLLLGTAAGAGAVQVLLLVALVPTYGATGAAIAYAVAMCGMYAVYVAVSHRDLVAQRGRK